MLTKTLKILEQRSLIKSIRSVVSKSKKLYVLFDVVPAKSVTGGPWYSDQEFDHEFVSELSNFIVQMVHAHKEQMMDLAAIAEKIRISGISKVWCFMCILSSGNITAYSGMVWRPWSPVDISC